MHDGQTVNFLIGLAFRGADDGAIKVAGGDIRQKLEFQHVHLELGALGYIETFLFYWSWGF